MLVRLSLSLRPPFPSAASKPWAAPRLYRIPPLSCRPVDLATTTWRPFASATNPNGQGTKRKFSRDLASVSVLGLVTLASGLLFLVLDDDIDAIMLCYKFDKEVKAATDALAGWDGLNCFSTESKAEFLSETPHLLAFLTLGSKLPYPRPDKSDQKAVHVYLMKIGTLMGLTMSGSSTFKELRKELRDELTDDLKATSLIRGIVSVWQDEEVDELVEEARKKFYDTQWKIACAIWDVLHECSHLSHLQMVHQDCPYILSNVVDLFRKATTPGPFFLGVVKRVNEKVRRWNAEIDAMGERTKEEEKKGDDADSSVLSG